MLTESTSREGDGDKVANTKRSERFEGNKNERPYALALESQRKRKQFIV